MLWILFFWAQALSAQYAVSINGSYNPQFDAPVDITIGPDELSYALDIGFSFIFFDNTYTSFYLSSNGFITFDPTAGSGYLPQYIPDADDPNNLIALAWGSLDPDYVSASYETIGSAPNRRLHVSFYNTQSADPAFCELGYVLDGQIILYESTNRIEIHTTYWDGPNCMINSTQGIENEEGNEAFFRLDRNNTPWTAYQDYVAFVPASYIDISILGFEETSCEGVQDIKVLIQNLSGATVDSLYFDWEWDNVPQDAVFFITPLAPDAITEVTLGQKNFASNTIYAFEAWSYNPENGPDANPANDTIAGTIRAGLSGTFTIGGSGPDYTTISDAIIDLQLNGVCDSAIFNIRTGTYIGELDFGVINTIPGAYAVFQSESGNADDVIITKTYNSPGANRLVELNNTSHLRFRNLQFKVMGAACSNVLYATSFCEDISVTDCIFLGSPCTTTTTSGAVITMVNGYKEDIVIRDNLIRKGSYGLHILPGISSYAIDIDLTGNQIDSFYVFGAYLDRIIGLKAHQNEIFSQVGGLVGLQLNVIYGDVEVSGNAIYLPAGSYGLRVFGYNYNFSLGADSMFVFNNMINLAGSVVSSRALYVDYCDQIHIRHNTLNTSSTATSASGAYLADNPNAVLRNNIFTNLGIGNAAWLSGVNSDYNAFYSVNPPLLFNGTAYNTLEDWQNSSGEDLNSLQADPEYVGPADLHVSGSQVNNAGIMLIPPVLIDFDGDVRSLITPDIGADEFGPMLPNWPGGPVVYLDQDAVGLNDGTSWANAFTELGVALDTAAQYENVQEVWVAEGVYHPLTTSRDSSFVFVDSVKIYGGFLGIENNRSERSTAANLVFLSGDINQVDTLWDNSYHVVVFAASCNECLLDGVTITGGYADQVTNSNDRGAGVINTGIGKLYNVVMEHHYATDQGAALHSSGTGASLIIEDCIFRLNTSSLGRDVVNLAGAQVEFRGANGIH